MGRQGIVLSNNFWGLNLTIFILLFLRLNNNFILVIISIIHVIYLTVIWGLRFGFLIFNCLGIWWWDFLVILGINGHMTPHEFHIVFSL